MSQESYAMGYYDAIITAMKEEDVPQSENRIIDLITKICDESSMFEDAVHDIGAHILAQKIMSGAIEC